jgi:hypothetical protein
VGMQEKYAPKLFWPPSPLTPHSEEISVPLHHHVWPFLEAFHSAVVPVLINFATPCYKRWKES